MKIFRLWFTLIISTIFGFAIVVFLSFLYSEFMDSPTDTFEAEYINESPIMTENPPSPHRRFGLVYQTTSENFVIYTDESVAEYVSHIVKILEDAYVWLSEKLGVKLDEKVVVRVYKDFETYCRATGFTPPLDIAPNTIAGSFENSGIAVGIDMTPPNETIMAYPDKYYDKVLIHELVHALQVLITPRDKRDNITQWLFEGLAHYLSDTVSREDYQAIIESGVINNTIPSLNDFDKAYHLFKFGSEYPAYSSTIIEFVDKTYGFEKVMEMLKNPNEYNAVFGFDRDEFERQWHQFVIENYAPLETYTDE